MPAASIRSPARAAPSSRRARRAPLLAAATAGTVRWDRLGRLAMLCVLAALAYLYLSAGVRTLSALHQDHGDRAKVSALEREHRALESQHQALGQPGALEAQARQLGMMRAGEQPYVVSGLPRN